MVNHFLSSETHWQLPTNRESTQPARRPHLSLGLEKVPIPQLPPGIIEFQNKSARPFPEPRLCVPELELRSRVAVEIKSNPAEKPHDAARLFRKWLGPADRREMSRRNRRSDAGESEFEREQGPLELTHSHEVEIATVMSSLASADFFPGFVETIML